MLNVGGGGVMVVVWEELEFYISLVPSLYGEYILVETKYFA